MSFDEDDGSGRAETAGGDRFGHRLAFSVTEVAEVLGISRAHAYQLLADEEIPSVRLGRRSLVARADGRWQRGSVVEGLYLADTEETAWAECDRGAGRVGAAASSGTAS